MVTIWRSCRQFDSQKYQDTVKISEKYKQSLGSLQTVLDRPIVTNVKRTGELTAVTVALDFIKRKMVLKEKCSVTICYGHIWLGLKNVYGFSYNTDI